MAYDRLVADLLKRHAADQILGYKGNLAMAMRAVENEWLPDADDERIRGMIQRLADHLAQSGQPEHDGFLLRFGLAVPGLQRGIVPPLQALDDNRGGLSPRRKGEAQGQIHRLRQVLGLGRRLIPGLSPDTQRALTELAALCTKESTRGGPSWISTYKGLSEARTRKLAKVAIDLLDGSEESVVEAGMDLLHRLSCFRDPPLDTETCLAVLERTVLWPSSLYRDGGDRVAAQVISLLGKAEETLEVNHLLLVLGWTRSSLATEAILSWEAQPPAWTAKLHVPPRDYLQSAGWCLDEEGRPRQLMSRRCFRLRPAHAEIDDRALCRVPLAEKCSCGAGLSYLLDLSNVRPEYFQGVLSGAPRRVLHCPQCSCFEPVFSVYRGKSPAPYGKTNAERVAEPFPEPPMSERYLEDAPTPPFACAEAFAVDDASTLGGIPMWLQDAEYPRCPECARLMVFLAQFDHGSVGEEGISYSFFCAECQLAAVTYQQT